MNRRKKYGMKFIMLVIFIFPLAVSAKNYGEVKELSLLSKGISAMEIECGAGFLKLRGIEGLDNITVRADIIAGNKKGDSLQQFIEENVDLSLERHGEKAVLISRIKPSRLSSFFMKNSNNRIDLTVEVPMKMNLDIRDGSGDIEVKDINGELNIDDGSGSLDINNVDGKTRIHDGSGELNISNIIGKIDIRDGSGSIDVADIKGDIIISDGSGDIEVGGVKGELEIEDGSGSLRTTDIDGNVRIHDGSGSIYVDGVSRDLNIVESGSGGVQFKNVKGSVSGDI